MSPTVSLSPVPSASTKPLSVLLTVSPAPVSTNITFSESTISRQERIQANNQQGMTIWFTGLSASGKSTIASALEGFLIQRGVNSYRLDGDNIRFGLNNNLGFSPQDRSENIRRISEVAKLFADATVVSITSFISPYAADRLKARELHKQHDLAFVEVHVDVPIAVAESRDPKGLYKKARQGIIKGFTGIDSPYEAPANPEVYIRSDLVNVEAAVLQIVQYLVSKQLLSPHVLE